MTSLAPTLQLFFTERLTRQRQASPAHDHRLPQHLPASAAVRAGPHRQGSIRIWTSTTSRTDVISAFLDHLETDRHNSARSRNARLAALRSLFRYAALRHPEHAQLIQQVLAIPQKRFDRHATVSFLTADEVDALLAAPDTSRWEGRRDRALMTLAIQTGLRLSELIGLNNGDVQLDTGAHVRCTGKGRKQRCVPLTASTAAVLRVWLRERAGLREDPLFPTRTGRQLSDDAVEHRITIYKNRAAQQCTSLATKKVTPHVLRHTPPCRCCTPASTPR